MIRLSEGSFREMLCIKKGHLWVLGGRQASWVAWHEARRAVTIEVTQILTFPGSLEEAAWRSLRNGPALLQSQIGPGVACTNKRVGPGSFDVPIVPKGRGHPMDWFADTSQELPTLQPGGPFSWAHIS